MNEIQKTLYSTITQWELAERFRRDDFTFDAWLLISGSLGHKSPSTLRKMCESRSDNNCAKLGYDEAIIIMSITNDFRLMHLMKNRLLELKAGNNSQLNIFSEPMRDV